MEEAKESETGNNCVDEKSFEVYEYRVIFPDNLLLSIESIERFLIECRKSKINVITTANHRQENN